MVKPARVAGEQTGVCESTEPALSVVERDVARTKTPVSLSSGFLPFGDAYSKHGKAERRMP
jgi:hypothetical protein